MDISSEFLKKILQFSSKVENMQPDEDEFNAKEFVNFLLKEGAKIPCDDSHESYNRPGLPPFYNQILYQRGRRFFFDNIFALFFAKLLGLLSGLAIPSMLQILIHTNMSATPVTAYKRYMSTLNHMCLWYENNPEPGTRLWKSLLYVKNRHNSASKRCFQNGLHRITQKDMALTQFGFMGYALIRSGKVGIFGAKPEDWRGFIHVWRVVGYLIGIEDRFNICRDSVGETVQICEILAAQIVRPAVEEKNEKFLFMVENLMEGMWAMNPVLNTKAFLVYLHNLLTINQNERKIYLKLNYKETFIFYLITVILWSLQFRIFRYLHNFLQILSLHIMKIFPFLAYYKFGIINSEVNIILDYVKTK